MVPLYFWSSAAPATHPLPAGVPLEVVPPPPAPPMGSPPPVAPPPVPELLVLVPDELVELLLPP